MSKKRKINLEPRVLRLFGQRAVLSLGITSGTFPLFRDSQSKCIKNPIPPDSLHSLTTGRRWRILGTRLKEDKRDACARRRLSGKNV